MFPSHSNKSSSLSLELIDRFIYKKEKAKMPVMRVGSMMPEISKMELFMTIVAE